MERRVSSKVSCTVWSGGKIGDYIKNLPITIKVGRGDWRRNTLCEDHHITGWPSTAGGAEGERKSTTRKRVFYSFQRFCQARQLAIADPDTGKKETHFLSHLQRLSGGRRCRAGQKRKRRTRQMSRLQWYQFYAVPLFRQHPLQRSYLSWLRRAFNPQPKLWPIRAGFCRQDKRLCFNP